MYIYVGSTEFRVASKTVTLMGAMFARTDEVITARLAMLLAELTAGTSIPRDACRYVLPWLVRPGVTAIHGIEVVRADIPEPLVAVRLPR